MLVAAMLPMQAAGQRAEKFNPFTMFFVLGRYPAGLSGFQCFGLNAEAKKAEKPPYSGYVLTDLGDPSNSAIEMKSIHLSGRNLRFATESRRGLVFTFEGRFLRDGDLTRFSRKKIPLVEGIARKFVNGKKRAQSRMRFYCMADAG